MLVLRSRMASGGMCLVAAVLLSCSTDKLPCTDSGEAWLVIPESRVSAVAEVRAEGVCEVLKPAGDCAVATCVNGEDGQQRRLLPVRGRSQGTCTVTVSYADDCPSESVSYKFGGPLDNCCADVCIRSSRGPSVHACSTSQ